MTQRVLIVGGGLAGLALAQGLKRAMPSISFRIFERDANASFRAQGYRIRIPGDALRALLPPPLFAKFEATSVSEIGKGATIDALTGKLDPEGRAPGPPAGSMPPPSDVKLYNVDRTVLRNVLLQGLENDISFGKKFEKYTLLDNGSVSVKFADGTVEHGTLLVGADGVRSGIRRQLLPNFPMVDTEGRSVFGKTDLTDSVTSKLPKEFLNGMSLVGEPAAAHVPAKGHLKLLFEVMRFDPEARSLGLGVPGDYIYWVLCAREDMLDPELANLHALLSLSSAESTALAGTLMRDWHESVRAITDTPIKDSTATLAFFSCTKDGLPHSWTQLRQQQADSPVTLIGDAAHPMPPVGGVGARSAFEDAMEILQELDAARWGLQAQQKALASYEKLMVERVSGAVERSAVGAARFFGMRPPSELKPVSI